ncbi:hypothetical protein Hanom_Chr02g00121801 [Helianthus anomalus]
MLQLVCFLADLSLKKVCETSSLRRHIPSSSNLFSSSPSSRHTSSATTTTSDTTSSAATTSSATTSSATTTSTSAAHLSLSLFSRIISLSLFSRINLRHPSSLSLSLQQNHLSLFNKNQLPTCQNPPQNQERERGSGRRERERRERERRKRSMMAVVLWRWWNPHIERRQMVGFDVLHLQTNPQIERRQMVATGWVVATGVGGCGGGGEADGCGGGDVEREQELCV